MATVTERLQAIIDACTPSTVIFRPQESYTNNVHMRGETLTPRTYEVIESDATLQELMSLQLFESWDPAERQMYVDADPVRLFRIIKTAVSREYENVTLRCAATRRKTQQFIEHIELDFTAQTHLATFVTKVFVDINSPGYKTMSKADKQAMFEKFESLRRTYGKR